MKKFIPLLIGIVFITGCGRQVFGTQAGDMKPAVNNLSTVSLTFFGDMMLDRQVKKQIDKNGADYIFEKLYQETSTTLFTSDVIHANLEGPFANYRRATTKSIAFRFDPKLIPTLNKYGFDMVTVANNHTLDMGKAGLQENKNNLKAANIEYYGDGYGVSDQAVITSTINNLKFAFLGFNDTFYRLDKKVLTALIKKYRVDSDFVVVNFHWGDEYKTISNARERDLAHTLIDAGADIIIGHHPHVVQEMEIYNNRPIFYSLGNFVFDQYFSKETQQGLAVKIMVSSDKKLSAQVFPLQGSRSRVSLMNSEIKTKFMTDWVKNSRLDKYSLDDYDILKIDL